MRTRMKTRSDRIFDSCNFVIMILLLFIMLYPMWFSFIASFSDPMLVSTGQVVIVPKAVTLDAYRNVFINTSIWTGYLNTIFYTTFGTCWNLFLTIPTAYVLSKKNLRGRTFFSWYFLFTMYFSGGLIPHYLLVKRLGLLDTRWVLVILGGLSIYNMIVTRVFFQSTIPEELYESATIDGASHFRTFFQIALPLSKPIFAVMALYYGVSRWNDYFTALVYTLNKSLAPLQLVLRRILIMNESMKTQIMEGSIDSTDIAQALRQAYMVEAMKYALVFIASAPLLIVYPFVQKFFVKGVMIGSLKG